MLDGENVKGATRNSMPDPTSDFVLGNVLRTKGIFNAIIAASNSKRVPVVEIPKRSFVLAIVNTLLKKAPIHLNGKMEFLLKWKRAGVVANMLNGAFPFFNMMIILAKIAKNAAVSSGHIIYMNFPSIHSFIIQ